MDKYSKSIRKALHEISLHIEKLWEKFQQWKKSKISVWDLTALIHEYDYHTSRKIYSYYSRPKPEFTVPRAIAEGLLNEDEIPSNVLEAIKEKINGHRKLQESI